MNNQTLMGNLLGTVSHDPQLDAVFCVMNPTAGETPQARFLMNILAGIGQALANAPIPAFMLGLASSDITEADHAFIERTNIPFISGGLRIVIPALGKLLTWSEYYHAAQSQNAQGTPAPLAEIALSPSPTGSWSEHLARTLLAQHGIPTIPATLATSEAQAVAAASAMGFPVALKIASPDILHKSDIGGVRLGLSSEEAVRTAFAQVMQAAQAIEPAPRLEGVLVSPMRPGGIELLIGITRDANWGQVLAVGLGGIWVEILKDTSLRVLPVSRAEVRTMLAELQGAKLLQGARGAKAADLDAVVDVIYQIAELAQRLKTNLDSLEINPLRVDGTQIEALDAVITWQSQFM
jgi:acyl-CoA synthetase (NDP forming)